MIKVNHIFKFLCERYPLDTACDFDNPGFLVGDSGAEVKKALVCLDCDIDAVNKAIKSDCQLIITHHPVIWDGLKSVTQNGIVYKLIKNNISVISMHTNLDIAKDGVNMQLCKALSLKEISPFTASDGYELLCGISPISNADEFAAHIKQALQFNVRYANSGNTIKNVLVCCGSGGSFLSDAIALGFDALITADVKHDVFIDALNAGISVFDAGHYASERVIIKPLSELLKAEFSDVKFETFYSDKIKFI